MVDRELDDIAKKKPVDVGGETGSGYTPDGDFPDRVVDAVEELTSADDEGVEDVAEELDADDEGFIADLREALEEALDDDLSDVRAKAARALGVLGGDDNVDALRDASKDKSIDVANAATEALQSIRLRDEEDEADEDEEDAVEGAEDGDAAEDEDVVEEEDAGSFEDDAAEEQGDVEDQVEEDVEVEGGSTVGSGVAELDDGTLRLSDAVVLRLLESDNDGVSKVVGSSMRHAVESYPDNAEDEMNHYVEMMEEGRPVLRRYGSRFVEVVSDVDPVMLENHLESLMTALEDEDDVVQENAEAALANVTGEFPNRVAELVAEDKRNR